MIDYLCNYAAYTGLFYLYNISILKQNIIQPRVRNAQNINLISRSPFIPFNQLSYKFLNRTSLYGRNR